jgi:S1-C subfamily serine protease
MDETAPSRRRLLAVAGSALSASLAGCSLNTPEDGTSVDVSPASNDDANEPLSENTTTPARMSDRPAAGSELAAMYQSVVDSVTAVQIETGRGTAGGSAWVYDDSYLVTNEHVVADGTNVSVWFTGTGWRSASVVGTDVHSDLAVIEVENKPGDGTPLPLVEQPQPVGTRVAAIGNPFDLTSSFTTGVISGRNRTIPMPDSDFRIADGIQTDAALNPGNSGGPLVTYDGEVVGVVSAGRGDNIGFAISAAMTRTVVPSLIENGEYRHSLLGVRLADVQPRLIEANDLPVSWGVYVHEVIDGGPSDGILQGTQRTETVRGRDVWVGGDVIVRMGDWSIPTNERLSAFLALETEPGDTIEIEIIRDGSRQTVEVTVGARPE